MDDEGDRVRAGEGRADGRDTAAAAHALLPVAYGDGAGGRGRRGRGGYRAIPPRVVEEEPRDGVRAEASMPRRIRQDTLSRDRRHEHAVADVPEGRDRLPRGGLARQLGFRRWRGRAAPAGARRPRGAAAHDFFAGRPVRRHKHARQGAWREQAPEAGAQRGLRLPGMGEVLQWPHTPLRRPRPARRRRQG